MMDAVGDLDFDGYVTLNGAHCFTANHEDIYKGCVPQEDIERLIQYQHDHPEMPFVLYTTIPGSLHMRMRLSERLPV